ncbi:MAG: hypothetical protein J5598_02635 [Clostridia bacterium]|nr:hypothetical protein [Clostridia bacterium]
MAKFFTKKVCLIALAVMIAAAGIIWAVVANLKPKFSSGITEVPTANYVSGNGTASVMIDNYLYFVGDTVKTADIKYGDNEYYASSTMPDAGIFRVKIGDDNLPILDYEYNNVYTDEDSGEEKEYQEGDANYNTVVLGVNDWDNIGKKGNGVEAVVPKIAGHDKTAMWVFGKYLIYTSPHNRYNNRGNLMSDYLDFFRVDLNGNNHTLIYTTDSTDLTTSNFTIWADSTDNIYLLVAETDNESEEAKPSIKKINIKTKKVTVLDTDVDNVVLPTATQYGKQNESLSQVYGGVMSYVYYTKTRTSLNENSTLLGNLMYRCGINNGKSELIGDSGTAEKGTTFKPLAVTPYGTASAQFVFSVTIATSNATFVEKDLCVITNHNLDSYTYADPETNDNGLGLTSSQTVSVYANGFCLVDSALYHYEIVDSHVIWDNNNGEAKKLVASVDQVLAVIGDVAYVQSGTTISIVKLNGSTTTINTAINTTNDDTEDSSSSDENSTTLPVAVLYQPAGNTGNPIMFVHDDNSIRLYYANQTYRYLRFKSL